MYLSDHIISHYDFQFSLKQQMFSDRGMEEPFDVDIDPLELSAILEAHKTAAQHVDLKRFLVLVAEHYRKHQSKYTQPTLISFLLYLQRIIKTTDSGYSKLLFGKRINLSFLDSSRITV